MFICVAVYIVCGGGGGGCNYCPFAQYVCYLVLLRKSLGGVAMLQGVAMTLCVDASH